MLETRLDNVVYRLGFAASRAQARQLVRHGHFHVNGRRVNIPSYQVKPDDVITIRHGLAGRAGVRDATDLTASVARGCRPTTTASPARSSSGPSARRSTRPVQESLIVELYSK